MEFTPKKQIIPSYNASYRAPYSVGSQTSYKRLKKRINQSVSPQPSCHVRSPQAYPAKRFFSRAERIVNLSKIGQAGDATATPEIKSRTSPLSTKRPFSAVNTVEDFKEQVYPSCPDKDLGAVDGKKKPNDENDPYNFSSSHDFEIFDKRAKTDVFKDTASVSSPRISVVKSYSSKKKQLDLSRSKLLGDISPEKVEKAYGLKFKSTAEKENVPADTATGGESVHFSEPTATLPHLIGFANYGNTCYLNSVVQSLFGLAPFVEDLQLVSAQLNLPSTSLSSGLIQVIAARMKGQVAGVKDSLKTVKENLVRVDGSFSGYKMQDANEFLTRVLDTIKDEIDRCHVTNPSPDCSLSAKDGDLDELFPNSIRCLKRDSPDGEILENERISVSDITQQDCGSEESASREKVLATGESEGQHLPLCSPPSNTPSKGCDEETLPRNPVKDNFEFQLFESYRCLGCNKVEGRKQEYFGLYVNLPEENHESIQDALASCMEEDKRELKCEDCGHSHASVVTTVTRLPRILIVQLKRYEYKADQGESIKRSWKVPVTNWLTLDEYVVEDATSPSPWKPHSGSITPRSSKQTTLTVRNLSSELNVSEGRKEQEDFAVSASVSPKSQGVTAAPPTSDKEDEELQEVMLRSMDDFGGTREEDEIQQAIKLSLQDLGMSYTQENQSQVSEDQVEEESPRLLTKKYEEDEDKINNHRHAYRLISAISHFGCTTNTGHYVADVYNCEEESWFHYDDESVSKIPESVVLAEGRQKNGYIFFYMHKDVFQKIEKSNLHR